MRITTTYDEITDHSYETKKCKKCGKAIYKTFKASQTMNPFNRKSAQQIHEENRRRLRHAQRDWDAHPELCSKCKKEAKPDFEVVLVTKEDYTKTDKLRQEIALAEVNLAAKQKAFKKRFIGKCIQIKHNGKDRVAVVKSVHCRYGYYADCVLLRSDGKGLTQTHKQLHLEGDKFK